MKNERAGTTRWGKRLFIFAVLVFCLSLGATQAMAFFNCAGKVDGTWCTDYNPCTTDDQCISDVCTGFDVACAELPAIEVADPVPFGGVAMGMSSTQTVTIAKTGLSPLIVSNIQLIGTDASQFSLDLSGGPLPCNSTTPTIVLSTGSALVLNRTTMIYNDALGMDIPNSGSWFAMDMNGNSSISFSEKVAISYDPSTFTDLFIDSIPIGATINATGTHSSFPVIPSPGTYLGVVEQPAFDIWSYFGSTGMHFIKDTPVTDNRDGTLNFSGWRVSWNGIPAIDMGGTFVANNGVAWQPLNCPALGCEYWTFTNGKARFQWNGVDGGPFTLDHTAKVPIGDPSGFGGVPYYVHLEGTVSAISGCTVNVTFTPQSTGTKAASLEITSSATNTPTMIVALSGDSVLCTNNGMCDDNDPCTDDLCSSGTCVHTPDPVSCSSRIGVVRGYTWFQDNTWFLDENGNGAWNDGSDIMYSFGVSVDVPVTGDWNNDGTTEIGIVRGNTWFLDMDGNGTWNEAPDVRISWGAPTDLPVTGDWNGSGTTKIGVFRAAANAWFLDWNGDGVWTDGTDVVYNFGATGDVPVTGDWDGNGTTNIGVVRGNTWFLDMNNNGAWNDGIDAASSWGAPTDLPVTGDWNGSGTTKIGVFRAEANAWFLDTNGNRLWNDGVDAVYSFGVPGDIPITGKW